jgi:glutamine amidotransferase
VIAVVDYGAGNLRSVEFALDRLEVPHRRVAEPRGLEAAAGIVLPGVGAAESAMRELGERGLVPALRETERPLLGVCLGMQLLTETSDEGEGAVECLARIPGRTRRFRGEVRLPHIGWNRVRLSDDPLFRGLEREEWFYFLHGHRAECPEEFVVGSGDYGEPFPAALRRDRVAGVQFHPEKSGSAGLRVLRNFCAACEG